MGEQKEPTGTNPPCQYPNMGGPPNWTSIFTERPDLDPPGYAEALIAMADRKIKLQEKAAELETQKTKKKKKLGRGEKV